MKAYITCMVKELRAHKFGDWKNLQPEPALGAQKATKVTLLIIVAANGNTLHRYIARLEIKGVKKDKEINKVACSARAI